MKLDHFTEDNLAAMVGPCPECNSTWWIREPETRRGYYGSRPCPRCRDAVIAARSARGRIEDRKHLKIKRKA